ncbi:MAG: hypothetical protein KJ587_20230 [Alphaproteobacteria bacterium]|nr:hypothetical protein [Alphaproteobacteria bacterium]
MSFLINMDSFPIFAISLLSTLLVVMLLATYRRRLQMREHELAAVAVAYESYNDALSRLDGDEPYLSENLQGFIDYLSDSLQNEEFAEQFADRFCMSIKKPSAAKKTSGIAEELDALRKLQPQLADNVETVVRNAVAILMLRWKGPAQKIRRVLIETMLSERDLSVDVLKSMRGNGWNKHDDGAMGATA